jgi:tRNA A-37 threonylcarbamoyl transferase component Bud32
MVLGIHRRGGSFRPDGDRAPRLINWAIAAFSGACDQPAIVRHGRFRLQIRLGVDLAARGRSIVSIQKHRRFEVGVTVTRYDGNAGQWRSRNISEGGVFIEGRPLLAPRTEMEIALWLPNRSEIVGTAKVVWTNDPARSDARAGMPAGMGLEFKDMELRDRTVLRDYLREIGGRVRQPKLEKRPTLGDYELVKHLGSGGMGEVFQARHRRLQHTVALKRLHRRLATDPSIIERLFDEARFVTRIRHENIVDVYDFVRDGEDTYYVMQYLEGESLADVLDRGPISETRARRVGSQLASALAATHRHGIVHRDLKPDNVFLVRYGEAGDFVKLLDFGIAKLIDPTMRVDNQRTAAGVILGTPGYMSPEQLMGETATPKSDVYSLGVLLFEMVTGRQPFQSEAWGELALMHTTHAPPKPSKLAKFSITPELEAIILACLEKDPKRRPSGMEELRDRLLADQPAAAQSRRASGELAPPHGKMRVFLWSVVVLAASSAAAIAAVELVTRYLKL